MKFFLIAAMAILVVIFSMGAERANAENPKIVLDTSKGKIILELFPAKAPETVKNFLAYVESNFYDGTIFHRVIPNFMIQGGGFTADFKKKAGSEPIQNEADNGLKNQRGTIAMARTADPHSATSQFFINSIDNDFLNHKGKTPQEWGYVVFGRVLEGFDVVDAISEVKTTTRGMFRNVPVEAVVIRSARQIK